MFDGFVVMSGGHCTHPTGGPAIRLKHKKTLRDFLWNSNIHSQKVNSFLFDSLYIATLNFVIWIKRQHKAQRASLLIIYVYCHQQFVHPWLS